MKKQKLILPVLAPAMILAGGLLANNTYADTITEGVYLTDADGVNIECAYYTNETGLEACTDEAGVWDNTKKELTIGSEADVEHLLNGNRILIMGMGDSAKITSAVDLSATAITSESALTLDFGEKTLVVPAGSRGLYTGSLTIDGGTIVFMNTPLTFNDITINDGTLNSLKYLTVGNLEINGGTLSTIDRVVVAEKMDVKGGEVVIHINSDYGIELANSGIALTQTGGTINIDGGSNLNTTGISGYDATVDIKGGEMNLKNLQNGAWLYGDSTIKFEGGKTVIDKSGLHALYIQGLTDPENGIVFAEGMGIKEKSVVVHWDTADHDESKKNTTGISDNGTVTIEKGGTVTKKKGWTRGDSTPGDDDEEEAPGSAGEDEEESDVKVPDTGASINSEEGGALSIFAASTFALLSVIALATAHKKHAAGHFKFDK